MKKIIKKKINNYDFYKKNITLFLYCLKITTMKANRVQVQSKGVTPHKTNNLIQSGFLIRLPIPGSR